ncbi:MAG: xanthine dehydrogenase family protein molybdopterin-binding subunit [Thermoanaerobaculia bacterium]|nr:xanthine dehydrogenase family protein molybdopterin-binding subunit [Thermoanaerobaculia bacterium]
MSDETRVNKKVILPHGISTGKVATIERDVPADEPDALPPNEKLRVIGRPVRRIDGQLKVTGEAVYTADIRLPGMLWAAFVTSPHPHARIKAINTSAAEALRGVRAIHVIENLQGSASLIDESEEISSRWPVIRYAGQPIAAVAAISRQIAEEAVKLVEVEYETMPFVVRLEEAQEDDAPLVFPGPAVQGGTAGGGGGPSGVPQEGNVRGPATRERGDVAKGMSEADIITEGEFRTQVQTHSAMETHGVVADWNADGLTIYASTQGTVGVRDDLAEIFDLPLNRVRVITEFMGGGFGAKFGPGNVGVVATHLSRKAGVPVRMMLDRKNEHLSVGNRPDSHMKIRIGAKKDGTITAIDGVSHGTGGVGTGAGAMGPVRNMYSVENMRSREYDVFTNAGPATAFRAPGHPQGCFGLEQTIDMLAEDLGIDPLELRDMNDTLPARREERRIGAETFGWSNRSEPGSTEGAVKRGMGVAQSVWYRLESMDSAAEVRILRDGSVELFSAVQDIGTGIRTVLAQVVAEELGLEPEQISIRIGDTAFPPGPQSGGSMTTSSITPPARNAAVRARELMVDRLARALEVESSKITIEPGRVIVNGSEPREMTFREAAGEMGVAEVSARADRTPNYVPREKMTVFTIGGVQFAEVSVDTETGVVTVDRMLAVHDCGRPMNTLQLQSQINGGIIQGISYALYEDRILDRNTGLMVNPNLEQYKIAGAREVPPIDIIILEEYTGLSSTDALGIGEPATIPTAAAVANAIYNAIGVRMTELPITPARVLNALVREGRI